MVAALLSALASPAHAEVVGSASGSGDYANAIASGTINYPSTVRVRVSVKPSQTVKVNWNATCSRGMSAKGRTGNFTLNGSATRTLRMPLGNADMCIVAAGTMLEGSGRVTVAIIG